MPLEKGSSRKAIAHNIKTEERAGRSHEQAVAIALSTADRAKEHNHTMHRVKQHESK